MCRYKMGDKIRLKSAPDKEFKVEMVIVEAEGVTYGIKYGNNPIIKLPESMLFKRVL